MLTAISLYLIILKSIIPIRISTVTLPTNPISSEIEAKMKSVLCSGKNCNCVPTPLPRPLPKNIPEPTDIVDCMAL